MRFILFDFQIAELAHINICTLITEYNFDRSIFRLRIEDGKITDWDFIFINFIYQRYFKKEIF